MYFSIHRFLNLLICLFHNFYSYRFINFILLDLHISIFVLFIDYQISRLLDLSAFFLLGLTVCKNKCWGLPSAKKHWGVPLVKQKVFGVTVGKNKLVGVTFGYFFVGGYRRQNKCWGYRRQKQFIGGYRRQTFFVGGYRWQNKKCLGSRRLKKCLELSPAMFLLGVTVGKTFFVWVTVGKHFLLGVTVGKTNVGGYRLQTKTMFRGYRRQNIFWFWALFFHWLCYFDAFLK